MVRAGARPRLRAAAVDPLRTSFEPVLWVATTFTRKIARGSCRSVTDARLRARRARTRLPFTYTTTFTTCAPRAWCSLNVNLRRSTHGGGGCGGVSLPTTPTRAPGHAPVFAQWNAAHGSPLGDSVSVKKN